MDNNELIEFIDWLENMESRFHPFNFPPDQQVFDICMDLEKQGLLKAMEELKAVYTGFKEADESFTYHAEIAYNNSDHAEEYNNAYKKYLDYKYDLLPILRAIQKRGHKLPQITINEKGVDLVTDQMPFEKRKQTESGQGVNTPAPEKTNITEPEEVSDDSSESDLYEDGTCLTLDKAARNNMTNAEPNDLITLRIAIGEYIVSRSTLQRRITGGSIKSYRFENAANNSEHMISRSEIGKFYSKRK